jgi:hypothetical protein
MLGRPSPTPSKLARATVSGGSKDGGFQLGKWERVDPNKAIRWTWEAKPSPEFNGAEFDIIMEAAQEEPEASAQTAAEIPVQLGLDPDKSWWEKYGNIICAIVGGLCGGGVIGPLTAIVIKPKRS